MSLLESGAEAKGPGLPGSSLPTVVCVKLKAVKKIKFHPNTVRRGDARTLNSWEFICWFLNSANAKSVFKTLAEKLGNPWINAQCLLSVVTENSVFLTSLVGDNKVCIT